MGHTGAPGPYNQFALDLKAAGNKWTAALCQKDSDNDGQTNGHELGDPCCGTGRALWTIGATPTYTNAQATNPAAAGSKSALPAGCPAAAAPTPPAPVPVVLPPPTPVPLPTPVGTPTPTPTPTPVIGTPTPTAPTPGPLPVVNGKLTCATLACDIFGPQSVYKIPGDGSNIGCLASVVSGDKCTKSECCIELQQVTCSAAVCGAGLKLRTPLGVCFGVCTDAVCCVSNGATVDTAPTGPDQCTINDDKCGVCIDNAPNCYWCNFALGGVGCTSQLAKCSVRAGTNYADTISNKDKCPVTGGVGDPNLPPPPTPGDASTSPNPVGNPYIKPNSAASVGASLMAGVLMVALLL